MSVAFVPSGFRRVDYGHKLMLFVPVNDVKLVDAAHFVVVVFGLVDALSVFANDDNVVVALVLLLAKGLCLKLVVF